MMCDELRMTSCQWQLVTQPRVHHIAELRKIGMLYSWSTLYIRDSVCPGPQIIDWICVAAIELLQHFPPLAFWPTMRGKYKASESTYMAWHRSWVWREILRGTRALRLPSSWKWEGVGEWVVCCYEFASARFCGILSTWHLIVELRMA